MNLTDRTNICIIGAGTMGTGIAAHLCNLGFEVTLLDTQKELAEKGLSRALQAHPSYFYTPQIVKRLTLGSIDRSLDLLSKADWVCEAIFEDVEAKQQLYKLIEPHLKPDALITTNTSSLEINLLASKCSKEFQARFMGTHFFNPPRYLKLIELISTPTTDPSVLNSMAEFLETYVGRRVVRAKDTPGFISNRYGMWSMFQAIHIAEKMGLSIEEVDLITGNFLGRPKSGSFRLNDLVGLDVMRDIADHIYHRCSHDPYRDILILPKSLETLLKFGNIGEKVGKGYYYKQDKKLCAFDLRSLQYRQAIEPHLPSTKQLTNLPLGERLQKALELQDTVGDFLREYLIPTLQYAVYVAPEISYNILDFDHIMQWGFGWEVGPFKLIDMIGHERLGISEKPFYIDHQMKSYADNYINIPSAPQYKQINNYKIIQKEKGFNIRDLEENILGISLTSKMGTLNPKLVSHLKTTIQNIQQPIILCSEEKAFSAGFDLNSFLQLACEGRWEEIDQNLQDLQELGNLLSKKQVVSAVHGYCLGGGFELACACSVIVAHPETHFGLPESKVGLLPAGGGTTRLRQRYQNNPEKLLEIFELLVLGKTSSCAEEATLLGYLRPMDRLISHPDRLITEAKRVVLQTQPAQVKPWQQFLDVKTEHFEHILNSLEHMEQISPYDKQIGTKLKEIFCKANSFQESLVLERELFIKLLHNVETTARIEHMLSTGKPLRN